MTEDHNTVRNPMSLDLLVFTFGIIIVGFLTVFTLHYIGVI